MVKTRVVHCKREPYDVMIDRTTMFGNWHYICATCTREQSIARFKVDFEKQIATDPEYKKAVLTLAGLTLGCWCKPLACHGDVIVEYLEGLNNDNNMS